MKIKRFVAPDMRSAIRMVREEQGPNAVILNNRRVPEGIEVVAAADYDATLAQQALDGQPRTPPRHLASDRPASPPKPEPAAAEPRNRWSLLNSVRELRSPAKPAAAAAAPKRAAPAPKRVLAAVPKREPEELMTPRAAAPLLAAVGAAPAQVPSPAVAQAQAPAPAPAPARADDGELQELKKELLGVRTLLRLQLQREPNAQELRKELAGMQELLRRPTPANPNMARMERELSEIRGLVHDQLARTNVGELGRISPQLAEVYLDLLEFGLPETMARRLVERVPKGLQPEAIRRYPWKLLERTLPVAGADLIAAGGVFALIGPTGVGKTTSIAKLAAQYVHRHGSRDVALVTTDGYRAGASEQLYTYGRLIGVPVHEVRGTAQLAKQLQRLSDYKLVLVDTAGLGLRDARLAGELQQLAAAAPRLRTMLVLSAMAGERDLAETVRRFRGARPEACILTHADESTQLGAAFGAAIAGRLPIGWFCDGQQIPDDLHLADAHKLMLVAVQRLHEQRRLRREARTLKLAAETASKPDFANLVGA